MSMNIIFHNGTELRESIYSKYYTSAAGHVYSLKSGLPKQLATHQNVVNGVVVCTIYSPDNRRYTRVLPSGKESQALVPKIVAVKTLIAQCWCSDYSPEYNITHKDHDRMNCAAHNLIFRGRDESTAWFKLTDEQVATIRAERGRKTRRELAKEHNISSNYVTKLWLGRVRKAKRVK